jgi:hypothetical protein
VQVEVDESGPGEVKVYIGPVRVEAFALIVARFYVASEDALSGESDFTLLQSMILGCRVLGRGGCAAVCAL